ncbi:MBL fold metallo-hydrolase [Pseudodonghicola xiamenensis]|uniref:MBL fold hydrolase n=1 Tax=Pseudodonghicola xiamenensis TaxID=337702 RepID=A0A8J3HAD2_9RHOB|nr:MBL fold metallo-hydrolase [Pseudodonghicola xiamenensis]GHG95134.1 MBL fold hydrolase [Pseudodonghicola xiamenensis]
MPQAPDDFAPSHGTPDRLQDGVRRLVAPNPSPMTYRGTNTYLVGDRELAVIDPGPTSEAHLEAILAALEPGQSISHIIVTHSHSDHSPLAAPLSERTGAPVLAFGGPQAGRSAVMESIAASGLAGGGEGIDLRFRPDQLLPDGTVIEGDGWQLEVIHTPGHLGNHIALAMGDSCFTADHVMGWATSLVSPPDGDLSDFMTSCRRLRDRNWTSFHPGHGAPIADPAGRLDWLIEHRLGREAQILEALADGPATTAQLARRIYTEVPAALIPAAERNVFAHLVDLTGQKRIETDDPLGIAARFSRLS